MDKPGPSKKRKVKDENRQFQEIWTEKYFFVWSHNKVVCLICKNSVAIAKEYNVKRHYETQHPSFTKFTGELRKQKMLSLKRELIGQQAMFTKPIQDSETATEVSYEISQMIAKRSRPFNDGDFVKECIEIAAKKMCPEAAKKFEKIQLNRMTIQRRIMSLSGNISEQLSEKTKIIEFFSLALDESTDISSTAQLLIFIRGVTQDFEVLEELLGMCSLKGQTKGVDILNVLLDECSKTDLDLSKLAGVATDGAPSMIGVNSGLVTLLKNHLQEKNTKAEDLMQFYCIIHQEALCAKKIDFQNVMKVVVSTINFIKSRGLNHRQFKQFLDDIESEYGDLLYYTEVRWLSRGLTLERFLNLIEEIGIFLAEKQRDVPELKNPDGVDITNHLNVLNTRLQGKNQLISQLYAHVSSFQCKLTLFRSQLNSGNYNHFPNYKKMAEKFNKTVINFSYVKKLDILIQSFQDRFSEFKKVKPLLDIFSNPFTISVENAPESMQLEIIDIQNDEDLRNKFNEGDLLNFYRCIDKIMYRVAHKRSEMCQLIWFYLYINRLANESLEAVLRVATSKFEPNIKKIVSTMQCHASN
ncbi:hypothetical protein PPYR_00102 [Photinus pyralis]|uniref:SPIN-DOC-like zinc-finger domain-containing protein n=1 Tax=Photinus pyralis TaxID=7054 RepID=A0A5N4B0L1_PHOPY|nr:hypothetical protein PPYR_00102 [Photinus pyralis]